MPVSVPRHPVDLIGVSDSACRRGFYLKLLAVGLVILGGRLWLLASHASDLPFLDQWIDQAARVLWPWVHGQFDPRVLIETHNEHRPLLMRLITLYLFILNGQWDPLVEITLSALLHTANGLLLIGLLRHYLGEASEDGIILGVGLLWLMPHGWENALWGFQIAWYLMTLFTLLALWGLLFHSPLTRAWWLGGISALLAFFNLVSGFFVLIAVAGITLYLLWVDRENRRRHGSTLVLVGALMLLCLPLVGHSPGLEYFRAANAAEFLEALARNLAWPWIYQPWLGLWLWLPWFWLLFLTLRHRRPLTRGDMLTLALGGWVILQAVILAYARGRFGDWAHSRYMDTLAFGPVAALAAWYCLARARPSPRRSVLVVWWLILIVGLSVLATRHTGPALQDRRLADAARAEVMQNLLADGDVKTFIAHHPPRMPGQPATLLPRLLLDQKFREVLPPGLQAPEREIGPLGRLARWLLARGEGLFFLGLILLASMLIQSRIHAWAGACQKQGP